MNNFFAKYLINIYKIRREHDDNLSMNSERNICFQHYFTLPSTFCIGQIAMSSNSMCTKKKGLPLSHLPSTFTSVQHLIDSCCSFQHVHTNIDDCNIEASPAF